MNNNLESGACELLTPKESEQIRRDSPDLIMKSRYVLTEKAAEPEDIEKLMKDGLLLESKDGKTMKAKARHVMKGFSENLESTPVIVQKTETGYGLPF